MSNVLVLGAGYVGNNLKEHLTDCNVTLVSRKCLDYHDQNTLTKYILNNSIDYVINCSGFTGRPNIDEAETKKELCWELNTAIPLQISHTCAKLNIEYIHISSGCIYTGYEKEFTEEDIPNFGLYDESSFYSKSKHAYETLASYGCVLRVRMPFDDTLNERSYLTKILKYDNLIDFKNSKTYLRELVRFIQFIISNNKSTCSIGTLNFVNGDPLTTSEVIYIMNEYGIVNRNWSFVEIDKIDIKAPRSNCVLSTSKLSTLFPEFNILSEKFALYKALYKIGCVPKE